MRNARWRIGSAAARALIAGLAMGLVAPWPGTATAGEDNPWPRVRKERIRTLLPRAMKRADVDAWVVVCRENANDPLALHVGGENAGGTAVFLFLLEEGTVRSVAFSPVGEATALADVGPHDEVIVVERGGDAVSAAAEYAPGAGPRSA